MMPPPQREPATKKVSPVTYSREELAAAHDHLIALSVAAQASGQWDDYCELFTEDALYIEHFLGTYHGRDEIKQWLIPAMTAWPQMRFPVQWRTFNEEEGLVVCDGVMLVKPFDGFVRDVGGEVISLLWRCGRVEF